MSVNATRDSKTISDLLNDADEGTSSDDNHFNNSQVEWERAPSSVKLEILKAGQDKIFRTLEHLAAKINRQVKPAAVETVIGVQPTALTAAGDTSIPSKHVRVCDRSVKEQKRLALIASPSIKYAELLTEKLDLAIIRNMKPTAGANWLVNQEKLKASRDETLKNNLGRISFNEINDLLNEAVRFKWDYYRRDKIMKKVCSCFHHAHN
jgi:hypothetical protein